MDARNHLVLETSAVAENVGVVRLCAAAFAAQGPFSVAEVEEIKVAVSEAATNVVLHAYPDGAGAIRLRGWLREDTVEFWVEDDGVGIADLAAARARASENPERMGMGFAFMESFMHEVAVESGAGQGTRVRMVKKAEEARAQAHGSA